MDEQQWNSLQAEWQQVFLYNVDFAAARPAQYDFWKTPAQNHTHIFGNQYTSVRQINTWELVSHLEKVDIYGTSITSLAPIAQLPQLKELYFGSTAISDLRHLQDLPIEKICCYNTPVTDAGPLATLMHLKRLCMARSLITDITPLKGLVHLEKLSLYRTGVKDLSPLSTLKGLVKLNINHTLVEDIFPLFSLPGLQELHCYNTGVSHQQLTHFRAAVPACTVIDDHEVSETSYDDFS